jgi:glutamine amidotransferase
VCRLYGFRANEPTKVECTLVHAQNALMVQSREDMKGYSHANGWGVATYEDHHPLIERQAWAAYHGEHFRRAAARIYSRTVLAHVRRATVGPPALENTHPFTHGPWSMAHNGTLPAFDAVRPRMLEQISGAHRTAIAGVTDSEHVFRLLMSRHDAEPKRPMTEILRWTVSDIAGWCREAAPDARLGLNLLLSDGDDLMATRIGRTLFHVERNGVYDCEICGFPHIHHDTGIDHRATVIASEPISHERWQEVPEGALMEIGADLELRICLLDGVV